MSGQCLIRELNRLAQQRGLPARIVLDDGPELTSEAMFFSSKRTKVRLHLIQPGKLAQDAFAASLAGRSATVA